MATGTIAPSPVFTGFDSNGNPLAGGLLYTYIAGTTTPIATYTDVGLSVANANPIVLDSAGRAVIFLSPGGSYKFVLKTSAGAAVWTQDNITSVPTSSTSLDITGIAGETLTAGQAVYLSAGDGGKTAGKWYKAESANAYSSSSAIAVGMVPASIATDATGSIRLSGTMTGLSSLTVGTTYYAGAAGALTATQPTNARVLGVADTTSSLVLNANPGLPNADNGVNDFRLSLTTAVPVTTADVTGASAVTIYLVPYKGNRIALFDTNGNATVYTSAQISIAVPATTNQMYDIFCYANAGVPTLELLAWTNDTTRATAIVLTTTGSYTKSGDLTRRYVGSFRTTGVSGQTEDSFAKRYLWNFYHRVRRIGRVLPTTDTWTYNTNTFRQANADTANQLDFVIGVAEVALIADVTVIVSNTNAAVPLYVAIGEDSTTTPATGCRMNPVHSPAANIYVMPSAHLEKYPAVGRHTYVWLEKSGVTVTTTFRGDGGGTDEQSGIYGSIEG